MNRKGRVFATSSQDRGELLRLHGVPRARGMKGVQIVEVSVEPGDEVGEIVSSTARVGHVIAEGENAEQAIVKCRSCTK